MPIIYRLGSILGDFIFTIAPTRRMIALRNLELCFPNQSAQELHLLCREAFRNIMRATLSCGIGWWAHPNRLGKLITLVNSERYRAAINSDQNVILLAPHFVALEIGGIYLSMASPVASIYQHSRNHIFDKLMLAGRSRFNAKMFERKDNLTQLIRQIKSGTIFYYLPDQDPGVQWDPNRAVFAPFFGVQAATWAALSRIAKLTNAVVLPCATKIRPDGQGFEIIFGPKLEQFPSGDLQVDAAKMNKAIELLIKDMPDQYFWAHRRFKTQPNGHRNYYADPPVSY